MTTHVSRNRMPVVFVSHGAPTLAVEDGAAHRFLREYGAQLGKPRAIVVLSAHFVAPVATITSGRRPGTIHDFGGFPPELYALTYPAPGDPDLADRVAAVLSDAAIPTRQDTARGFDHGAWVPLRLMYPDADVPVVQLSLDPRRGPEYHYRLGQLLAPLRDDGILILGSGGVTHNLGELQWRDDVAGTPHWAGSFNEWVATAIAEGRAADLVAYRQLAPDASRNHPTEEHFFPLLCVLGASRDGDRRRRVHHSFTMGALSMDAYQFGETDRSPA